MLRSTLWLIRPSNQLSKVDLVFQFLLNTSMSIEPETKSLEILQQFPDLLVSGGDRPNTMWKLCWAIVLRDNPQQRSVHFRAWLSMSWLQAVMYFGLCSCADQLRGQFSLFPSQFRSWHVLLVEYIQNILHQWTIQGRPNRLAFAISHTSLACSEFSLPSFCRLHTLTRKQWFVRWRYKHCHPETSPLHPSSTIVFSYFLPIEESSQWVTVKIALQRYNWIVNWVSQRCGRLAFGTLIQIFGQFSSERWWSSGASFILTCVYALTASPACPEQPCNLELTSKPLAAVICDAEAPCSVNTAWFLESSFTISPLNTSRPLLLSELFLQFKVLDLTQVR